ncbi:hypothetical protein [Labedella endophytica]|uniref:Uncharacterized protein n=1 Tax=Labedella endophytica TaxID=1523160 RepID=A0A3S0VD36_9MICO|nr:hypothetical protein [Labedella endophytica]RUR03183.1 hypothetical protein ELQ94_01100 [Labedella endophytica]
MTTAIRPALERPAESMRIGSATPSAYVAATQGAAGAVDRRLAALVDELGRRDEAARAEREARRPIVWLTALTVGAVTLAQLAVLVMVAPPL